MNDEVKRKKDAAAIKAADSFYVTRDPSPAELQEEAGGELLAYMRVLRADIEGLRRQMNLLGQLVQALLVEVRVGKRGSV